MIQFKFISNHWLIMKMKYIYFNIKKSLSTANNEVGNQNFLFFEKIIRSISLPK